MEPANSPPINPLLVLALGVVGVSFSAIFVRMTSAPATVTAFYRLFFHLPALDSLALRNRRQFRALNKGSAPLPAQRNVFELSLRLMVCLPGPDQHQQRRLAGQYTSLLVVGAGWRHVGEKFRPSALPWAGAGRGRHGGPGLGRFSVGERRSRKPPGCRRGSDAGRLLLAGQDSPGQDLPLRLLALVYGTSALLLLAYNLASSAPLSGFPATDWLAFAGLAVFPYLCGHTSSTGL